MDILTHFSAFAEKVSPTVWGVILGSLSTLTATLSAVILTNRANDRRFRAQLAHDLELKNRDREMTLRKDVYLAAVETISAGLVAVGQFANTDIPHDKLLGEYQSKASSLSKIHVIAKEATARTISIFSGELSATFLRLFTKRLPLLRETQEIAILRGQVDLYLKEQSRILELMRQYNLDGLKDPHRWGVLQSTFDFERDRIYQAGNKADELAAKLYVRQIQFMEECVGETLRLGRLLVPVIVSVRKELDLPIDESEYSRLVEETIAKQVEVMREFTQHIQSLLPPDTSS